MKKYILLSVAALGLAFTSCNEVLERPELNIPTDEAFWRSENDVRLYANNMYTEYFVGYNSGWTDTYTPVRGMTFADIFTTSGRQAGFTTQAPSSQGSTAAGTWNTETTGQTWNFSRVRVANVMLNRLETRMKGILSDEQYAHWDAVAKFFKAHEYVRLVTTFGGVPYFEKETASTELEELYKDRDSREFVMDKIYDLCKDIMANMRENDGANVLNRYVAAGYISRWMLFEGTWQKYHNHDDARAKKFLDFAVEAGNYVIGSGKYSIATSLPELFGSQDLKGNAEVLLYRKYSDAQAVRHCIASYSNGKEAQPAVVNLWFLKSVICNDGKPYTTSTVDGHDSFELTTFAKSRDPRFEASFSDKPSNNSATRVYCRKFIDRAAWERKAGDTNPLYESVTNLNACPVMRYGEVLLNWIEAKAELGNVTQDDIDKSINALRARPLDQTAIDKGLKQTVPMKLADINAAFDPNRDQDVDPLIWEIRRERTLELAYEYSRIVDLRRWKKLSYMDNEKNPDTMLGCWLDYNHQYDQIDPMQPKLAEGVTTVQKLDGTKVTYDGSNAADMVGFHVPNNIQPRYPFTDRVYLYPIGMNQISTYKDHGYKLTQNPGWEL